MQLKEGRISIQEMVIREDQRDRKRKFFRELEVVLQIAQAPLSLDMPFDEDENYSFLDAFPDRATETPEESLMKKYTKQQTEWLLSYLSERERNVVSWRFGIGDENPCSFQQIARNLGISKQGARKILIKALTKLKEIKDSFSRCSGII